MATSYPGAIDAFTNPAGTDPTTSPDHAAQHANANDAIEAIQTALGANLAKLPLGVLGHASKTTSQGSIGAVETDLAGLSVAVNVLNSNRRIRIVAYGLFQATASELAVLRIKEGATQLTAGQTRITNTADQIRVAAEVVINPPAGAHTYKLTAISGTGSGFLTLAAAATFPAQLIVEDIGPMP